MDIIKFFTSFLQENSIGYESTETSLAFSNSGKNYLLIIDSSDQDYYRLTLPKLGIPERIPPNKLNEILIKLTSDFKVGKVVKINNNGTDEIWLSYEQLLIGNSMNDCSYIFSRSMKILSEMLDDYRGTVAPYLESELDDTNKTMEIPHGE